MVQTELIRKYWPPPPPSSSSSSSGGRGGGGGMISPEESVREMLKRVSLLGVEKTGTYLEYDGNILPW